MLYNQFTPVYEALKQGGLDTQTVVDLSDLTFLRPLTILPLAALINEGNAQVILPRDPSVSAYLSTVLFPKGSTAIQAVRGSYIPIGRINTNDPVGVDRMTEVFEQLILKQLGSLPEGARTAITYPIAEITTNILDHSKQETGWIFGQHYQAEKRLDICILDRGRGFRRCYKEELALETTDEEAIKFALKGRSCKTSRTNERGFGLWTTKRMVTEGLGGECFILSGSAAYYASQKEEMNLEFETGISWNGVIVAFRIPYPTSPIDPTQYYE